MVNIYASRVILQALGVEDYGIINVVGGFVGMFAILSSSLVHASQRFISYEMGKENPELKRVFNGTVSIHLLLSLFMLVLFESFGIWFLNTHLNISYDRLYAANWVFQFSILTFCVNILSTPFNACIIAHEKMSAFAYIGIFEAFAKLGIIYLLFISIVDKLIVYSGILFMISMLLWIIYVVYCRNKFQECRFQFSFDRKLLKDLFAFSGWNFLGSAAGILLTQGINILTNIFFGVALNAARGIAEQVNNAINQFVTNFMTAMNPQITQSHASKDFKRMNILMLRGAKYASLLYWMFGVIVFLQSDFLLEIWLTEVPAYANIFLKFTVVYSLFQSLSNTLYIGMLATGNIKKYQIYMSSLYICCFLVCFLFFSLGFGPEYGYVSTIIAILLAVFLRLSLLRGMIPEFSIKAYFENVLLKVIPIIILSIIIGYMLMYLFSDNSWVEFLVVTSTIMVLLPLLTYYIALDKIERNLIICILKKIMSKI